MEAPKFIDYSEVKTIAESEPGRSIDVSTYELLSQFNKICGNVDKADQAKLLREYLSRSTTDKHKRSPYVPMAASDIVFCFQRSPIPHYPRDTFRYKSGRIMIEEIDPGHGRNSHGGNFIVRTADAFG